MDVNRNDTEDIYLLRQGREREREREFKGKMIGIVGDAPVRMSDSKSKVDIFIHIFIYI